MSLRFDGYVSDEELLAVDDDFSAIANPELAGLFFEGEPLWSTDSDSGVDFLLGGLTSKQRKAVKLWLQHPSMSITDIASDNGVDRRTFQRLLQRAFDALRETHGSDFVESAAVDRCYLCGAESDGRCLDCDRRVKARSKMIARDRSLALDVDDVSKTCGSCGLVKESSSFHRQSTSGDGLGHWCKQCDAKSRKSPSVSRGHLKVEPTILYAFAAGGGIVFGITVSRRLPTRVAEYQEAYSDIEIESLRTVEFPDRASAKSVEDSLVEEFRYRPKVVGYCAARESVVGASWVEFEAMLDAAIYEESLCVV